MTDAQSNYLQFPVEYHPSENDIKAMEEAGLIDASWINNSVPNWAFYKSEEAELPSINLWIEPDNEELRTEGVTHKYGVELLELDGLTTKDLLSTNCLTEALSFVKQQLAH